MAIKIETNIPQLQSQIEAIAKQKLPWAMRQTLNDLAFGIRDATYDEMKREFDRPKPNFTLRSMEVIKVKRGTQYPEAWVGLGLQERYQKALSHEFKGGDRAWKRMEGALMRAGIMPKGLIAVPGGGTALDSYGNISPAFIVRLISYFQAFSEAGYRANMTDKKKSRLAKFGKTKEGFKTINGVAYFVAYGSGRTAHLAKGIYAKTSIHGFDVKPVLLFVRRGRYEQRIDLMAIGRKVMSADGFRLMAKNLARGIALRLGDVS